MDTTLTLKDAENAYADACALLAKITGDYESALTLVERAQEQANNAQARLMECELLTQQAFVAMQRMSGKSGYANVQA